MHHWFVWFILEVGLPARAEVRSGPGFKLLELLGSGTNLDTGIDTVGSKGSGALEIPFIEHTCTDQSPNQLNAPSLGLRTFLGFRVAAGEVIK